jgi:hypothetical protein
VVIKSKEKKEPANHSIARLKEKRVRSSTDCDGACAWLTSDRNDPHTDTRYSAVRIILHTRVRPCSSSLSLSLSLSRVARSALRHLQGLECTFRFRRGDDRCPAPPHTRNLADRPAQVGGYCRRKRPHMPPSVPAPLMISPLGSCPALADLPPRGGCDHRRQRPCQATVTII